MDQSNTNSFSTTPQLPLTNLRSSSTSGLLSPKNGQTGSTINPTSPNHNNGPTLARQSSSTPSSSQQQTQGKSIISGHQENKSILKQSIYQQKYDEEMAKRQQQRERRELLNTVMKKSHNSYGPNSLGCFTLTNPLRRAAIKLISNIWFDRILLIVILLNCVFLALNPQSDDTLGRVSAKFEYFFIAIFCLEALIKIFALGIFWNGKTSYFRDPWNWLDFILTILGVLSLIPNVGNLTGLRALRVLRVFRSIRSVPGMRLFSSALFASIIALKEVIAFLILFLLIFGLFGVALYQGALRNRCFDLVNNTFDTEALCSLSKTDQCPEGWACKFYGSSPDYGLTSFDNILLAMITLFITISKEGWSDIMFNFIHVTSWATFVYFAIVIFFGAFYLINTISALIFTQFEYAKKKELDARSAVMLQTLAQKTLEQQQKDKQKSMSKSIHSKKDSILIERSQIRSMIGRSSMNSRNSRIDTTHPNQAAHNIVNLMLRPQQTRQRAPTGGRAHELVTGAGPNVYITSSDTSQPNHKSQPPPPPPPTFQLQQHSQPTKNQPTPQSNLLINSKLNPNDSQSSNNTSQGPLPPPHILPTIESEHNTHDGNNLNEDYDYDYDDDLIAQFTHTKDERLYNSTTFIYNSDQLLPINDIENDEHVNEFFEQLPLPPPPTLPENTTDTTTTTTTTNLPPPKSKKTTTFATSTEFENEDDKNTKSRRQSLPSKTLTTSTQSTLSGSGSDSGSNTTSALSSGTSQDDEKKFWKKWFQKHGDQENALSLLDFRTAEEKRLDQLKQLKLLTMDPNESKLHLWKPIGYFLRNQWYRWIVWPLFYITTHPAFVTIINIFVVLNVVVLSFDHWGISRTWENVNTLVNLCFTVVFILEVVLKLIAFSPKYYFTDPFNSFDFIIAVISCCDVVLGFVYPGTLYRLVRALRILRVFKLLRSWPLLRRILTSVYQSGEELLYFFGVVLCYFFVFSVIGMQFFGKHLLCEDEFSGEPVPCRFNFRNFQRALLLTYNYVTAENWNDTLIFGVDGTTYFAVVFFILMMFLGNCVLLAIFISILLSNVEHDHAEEAVQLLQDLEALTAAQEPTQDELDEQEHDDQNENDENDPNNNDPNNNLHDQTDPQSISSKQQQIQFIRPRLDSDTTADLFLPTLGGLNEDDTLQQTSTPPLHGQKKPSIQVRNRTMSGGGRGFQLRQEIAAKRSELISFLEDLDKLLISFQNDDDNNDGLKVDINDYKDDKEYVSLRGKIDKLAIEIFVLNSRLKHADQHHKSSTPLAIVGAVQSRTNASPSVTESPASTYSTLSTPSNQSAPTTTNTKQTPSQQTFNIEDLILRGKFGEHGHLLLPEHQAVWDRFRENIASLTPAQTNNITPLVAITVQEDDSDSDDFQLDDVPTGGASHFGNGTNNNTRQQPQTTLNNPSSIELVSLSKVEGQETSKSDENNQTNSQDDENEDDEDEDDGEVYKQIQLRHAENNDEVFLYMTLSYYPYHVDENQSMTVSITGQLKLTKNLVKNKLQTVNDQTVNKVGCVGTIKRFFKWLFTLNEHLTYDVFSSSSIQKRVAEQIQLQKELLEQHQQHQQRLLQQQQQQQQQGEEEEDDDDDNNSTQSLPKGKKPSPQSASINLHTPPQITKIDSITSTTPPQITKIESVASPQPMSIQNLRLTTPNNTSSQQLLSPSDQLFSPITSPLPNLHRASSNQYTSINRNHLRDSYRHSMVNLHDAYTEPDEHHTSTSVITFNSPSSSSNGSTHTINSRRSLLTDQQQLPHDARMSMVNVTALSSYATLLSPNSPHQQAAAIQLQEPDLQQLNPLAARKIHDKFHPVTLYGKSFFIFGPKNPFRVLAARLSLQKPFQLFILFAVVFSCVIVALQASNFDQNSRIDQILDYCEYANLGFFLLEILFRMLIHGVILHKNAYLRNPMAWIEVLIIVTTAISIFAYGQDTKSDIRILLAFRGLRPLRLMDSIGTLKLVFNASVAAALKLGSVLSIALLVFLVFAVIGVSLFKGQLSSCQINGPDGVQQLYQASEYICNQLMEGNGQNELPLPETLVQWGTIPGFNFDNVLNGLIFLFHSSTFEMWPTSLVILMDAAPASIGPSRSYSGSFALPFFILFLFCGGFFMISLFTGVVVYEYENSVKDLTDSSKLSEVQQEYLELYTTLATAPLPLESLMYRNPVFWCCTRRHDRKALITEMLQDMMTWKNSLPTTQPNQNTTTTINNNNNTSTTTTPNNIPNNSSGSNTNEINTEDTTTVDNEDSKTKPIQTFEDQIKEDVELGYQQIPQYYRSYPFEERFTKFGLKEVSRSDQFKRRKFPGRYGVGSPYTEVKIRNFFFIVSQSRLFQHFCLFMILLNAAILCLQFDTAPHQLTAVLAILSDICLWWFVAEVLIKLVGLGPYQYLFSDNTPRHGDNKLWARFDVAIVILSLLPFITRYASSGETAVNFFGIDPTILRVFRIFKLSLLSKYLGTDAILLTLYYSLPSIISIGFVLLCVFFFYAIFGAILFSEVRFGLYLNENTNFKTFLRGMLTLFISTTGENWNGIMSDLMISPPLCDPEVDCGFPIVAPIYYISFTIISLFLILNVFIAIVVNHYESQVKKQLEGPSDAERRKIAKRLKKEKRKKQKYNQIHNIFDSMVDPIGDDEAFSAEVDELLGFDFSIPSSTSVTIFLKNWGIWRKAQIEVLWSDEQNLILQEILQSAKDIVEEREKNGITTGNDEIYQLATDLISYLYGALVYRASLLGHSHNSVSKSLLDFQYTSWKQLFTNWFSKDKQDDIVLDPVWMHVSTIITFLNWCPAPLGFRDAPLTPAETIRLLTALNIRHYNGYVHVIEVGLALIQSLYGNEVLEISPLNETALNNKAIIKKRYPQLALLKSSARKSTTTTTTSNTSTMMNSNLNAGDYLSIIRAQRAVRNYLAKRQYIRSQQQLQQQQTAIQLPSIIERSSSSDSLHQENQENQE